MNSTTNAILTGMKILTWIFFIGLCIKTGVLIFTTGISLFVNSVSAEDLYVGLDLSDLLAKNKWYFVCLTSLAIFTSGMRAYLCYWVVKIFLSLNLGLPFSKEIGAYIINLSYVALSIGLLNYMSIAYAKNLEKMGFNVSNVYNYFEGAAEFIFFAGVIFIISLVYKKGIALQIENDLTV